MASKLKLMATVALLSEVYLNLIPALRVMTKMNWDRDREGADP